MCETAVLPTHNVYTKSRFANAMEKSWLSLKTLLTILNFSSLAAVRRFLSKHGIKPANFSDINEEFADMRLAGQRRKKKYVRKQKESLKKTAPNLLRLYYRKVYHNSFFWGLYNALVERARRAVKSDAHWKICCTICHTF